MLTYLKKLSTSPKGPNFDNAPSFAINYSGIKLSFKAPAHTYKMAEKDEFDRQYNIYDDSLFFSAYLERMKHLHNPDTDVPGFASFQLGWSFSNGIVFKTSVVSLSFSIIVRKIPRLSNLFVPDRFERAVMETFDAKFGPFSSLGNYGRRFDGPLNWQYKNCNGLDWLGYNIQELKYGSEMQTQWCTPLTNEHFLSFEFYEAGSDRSVDPRDAVNDLITQIISSVEVEFTPDIQKYREQAQQQVDVSPFSKTRKPRYWIVYDDDPDQFLSESFRWSLERQRNIITLNLQKDRDKYLGVHKPTTDEQFETRREQARQLRKDLGLKPDQDPDHDLG
ncbi:MAG: hypothetical protein BMS9Abin31_1311 [Gammaproteobacteria bacterium]|nr:MAG: hypothetical protein BMS9Abin31_1311 [Gammaproteobacteria bacterium]